MMEIKSEPADLEGYISSPPTAVPLSRAERQQKLEVKDQEADPLPQSSGYLAGSGLSRSSIASTETLLRLAGSVWPVATSTSLMMLGSSTSSSLSQCKPTWREEIVQGETTCGTADDRDRFCTAQIERKDSESEEKECSRDGYFHGSPSSEEDDNEAAGRNWRYEYWHGSPGNSLNVEDDMSSKRKEMESVVSSAHEKRLAERVAQMESVINEILSCEPSEIETERAAQPTETEKLAAELKWYKNELSIVNEDNRKKDRIISDLESKLRSILDMRDREWAAAQKAKLEYSQTNQGNLSSIPDSGHPPSEEGGEPTPLSACIKAD